jgi:hypothetical protein
MKRNSTLKSYKTLKRGNGFKKVVGNSLTSKAKKRILRKGTGFIKESWIPLKKSSFKRTPTDIQKEVKESDNKFSKFIINRDKKCLRCGSTKMLSCSHFHGRSNWATRFEPLNCVTLCIPCHEIMESKKKEGMEYHQFMFTYLGTNQFTVLTHISKMDISKTDSLILARNLLSKVETNSDIQY